MKKSFCCLINFSMRCNMSDELLSSPSVETASGAGGMTTAADEEMLGKTGCKTGTEKKKSRNFSWVIFFFFFFFFAART